MPKADLTIHPNQRPRTVSVGRVRIREDVLFTDANGEEGSGIRKRTENALRQLQAALGKVLEPEEAVLYIVSSCEAPASTWEQLALGRYIYRQTAAVLVLTNLRLIHFTVNSKGEWMGSLQSVRWGDVASAGIRDSLNRMLELQYADGRIESYWRLCRDDANKVEALLAALLPASPEEGTAARGMVPLCPECCAIVTPDTQQCALCGLAFKDERSLLRWAVLFPGGGYFYAGNWFLGLSSLIIEGALLVWLVAFALLASGILTPTHGPGQAIPAREKLFWSAGLTGMALVLDKLVALRHCRRTVRDFLPLRRSRQN